MNVESVSACHFHKSPLSKLHSLADSSCNKAAMPSVCLFNNLHLHDRNSRVFSLSSGSAFLWKAGSLSLITPGKSNWKYALKKEASFYLFWKTKPRHSCQIFLTVRMIEEGWYFIGHFLACALALTPTQWLQSRKGNCMCQCPKEKKQTGFI